MTAIINIKLKTSKREKKKRKEGRRKTEESKKKKKKRIYTYRHAEMSPLYSYVQKANCRRETTLASVIKILGLKCRSNVTHIFCITCNIDYGWKMCRIILLCFNGVYLWEWENWGLSSLFISFCTWIGNNPIIQVPAQRSLPLHDHLFETPRLPTVPSPCPCLQCLLMLYVSVALPVCLRRPWASRGQGLGPLPLSPDTGEVLASCLPSGWRSRPPGEIIKEGNSTSSLDISSGRNPPELIGAVCPEGLLPFFSGPESALQHRLPEPQASQLPLAC